MTNNEVMYPDRGEKPIMRTKFFCMLFTALAVAGPSSAFAGSAFAEGQIFFAPDSVSAIPTLSSGMLIALAGLLLVMAFRFSRHKGNVVRSVAGGLLVSGLIMGGFGIEKSVATSEHTIQSDECSIGGNHTFQADRLNAITNSCPNSMRITALFCNSPNYSGASNPPCTVGTVLNGGGDQCDAPRCTGVAGPGAE